MPAPKLSPLHKLKPRLHLPFLVSCLLLLILLPILYLSLRNPANTAAWYDDNYAYRLNFTFTHNAAISAERAVTFSLDTAELITAGIMQADCDDTRFTDASGNILKYQMTGSCNNSATTYEVVFPAIINGTNAAFVYYGNPSAISASQDVSGITALTPNGGDPALTDRTGEQKTPGPVVALSFDEGSSSTANDYTQQNNDGSVSGADWKTEDMCVSGKCLFFDGSDDVTTVTNATSIDFDTGLSAGVTFSAWIKVNSDGENSVGQIYQKGTNTYLRTTNDGSNAADLEASLDLGTSDATATVTDGLTLNQWHHVAMTYTDDGDDELSIYIDGLSRAASTNGSGAPATSDTANLLIGGTTTANFHGFIDEARVYNFERTAAQLKLDHQAPTASGVSAQFGSSNRASLSEGLVGYWPMDETSGNRADSSGNNFTLTDVNTVTSAAGKFGNAASFAAASSETFSLADNTAISIGTSNFTMSAWIYLASTGADRMIFRKGVAGGNDREYSLYYKNSAGKIAFTVSSNGSPGVEITSDAFGTLSTGTWYFVTAYHNATAGQIGLSINGGTATTTAHTGGINDTSNAFYIGSENAGGNYWDGRIDEVRLYKRLLSPAEIQSLYSWAPGPINHWSLDENTGSTANNTGSTSNSGSITSANWTTGKYGSGLKPTDTNGGVNFSDLSTQMSGNAVTWEAWLKLDAATTNDPDIIQASAGASQNCELTLGNANATPYVYCYFSSTEAPAITGNPIDLNTWQHLTMTFDGTSLKLYQNGIVTDSTTVSSTSIKYYASQTGGNFYVGSGGSAQLEGTIDDIRIYNYARTPAQIIEDMNAGHPVGGSPVGSQVAYWQFDEGYGTTANDQTPNGNSLTLNTASWTTSGKFNKAWNGTGGNIRMSRATDSDLEFSATEDFSLSLWYKTDSANNPGSTEYLVSTTTANADVGYSVYANTSGNLCFGIDDDTSWGPDIASCTSDDVYDGNWHHILAIRDYSSTDKTYLYIDGILKDLDSDTTTATLDGDNTFFVGDIDTSDDGEEFSGDIDELKIYRAALTIDQIRTEYNQGRTTSFGTTGTTSAGIPDNSSARTYCIPGDTSTCNAPVAEWKLDENTGTSSVNDTSTNGYTGSIVGSMTQSDWVPGKFGSALDFDGSDDHIQVSDNSNVDLQGSYTLELWFNSNTSWTPASPQSLGLIGKRVGGGVFEGWVFGLCTTSNCGGSEGLYMIHDSGPALMVTTGDFASVSANTWYHVAVTYDLSSTTANLYRNGIKIGTNTGFSVQPGNHSENMTFGLATTLGHLPGKIDDVRIYNYARTPAQIAWDFNRGAPIAHYQMDECQGPTIYNVARTANDSAAGNNGTLTIGGSGTNTAVGTCATSGAWFDGATGKYGSAMDFDGTDDYVSVADASAIDIEHTSPFSISAWIKTTDSDYASVIGKLDTGNNYRGYRLVIQNDGTLVWQLINTWSSNLAGINTTRTVNDGFWHHVAATYDGSSSTSGMKIYIDGHQAATSDTHNSLSATILNNVALNLGSGGGTSLYEPFTGLIDDVRIYNYPLTAAQVKDIMNTGAVNFQ